MAPLSGLQGAGRKAFWLSAGLEAGKVFRKLGSRSTEMLLGSVLPT